MKRIIKDNDGSAILAALALMIIITLVGIAAIDQATTDIDMSFNQQHHDQAFYIADAGLKRAVAKIAANPTWDTGFVNISYSNGKYTVNVIDSTTRPALLDTIIIQSFGELNSSQAAVETWLVPVVYNPFKYALFGDEWIDIRNSMSTDSYNSDSGSYATTVIQDEGSLGSNGDVFVKNGALVGGDAMTSLNDGLEINTGAAVLGDTTSEAPEQYFESISQSEYDWAEANSIASTGISGDYDYNPITKTFSASRGGVVLTGGVYYFSSFTLDKDASVTIPAGEEVQIYITGDIEIKNSGDVNPGGDPADLIFYSTGDLVLKNSGTLTSVFYCPDGSADLRNSSDFYGSICANDILCHNSAGFHYDRNLDDFFKKSETRKEQIAWREIE